jgi:GT2 family glycosyltransferase
MTSLESLPQILPVSVILITKNRHAKAEVAVRSVLGCDYDSAKREIVVIEETERPESIAGEGVRYLSIPCQNLGFAHARNIGVAHASHDLCAFLDDDCAADPGWLAALVRTLTEHPEAAAAGGAVMVGASGPIGKCENILGFPGGGMLYVHQAKCAVVNRSTFSTCNCIVRKKTLIAAGGFDERCRSGGEDEMLSLAMGRLAAILFSPHAIVYHEPRDGLCKVFNWFVRRGKARIANLSLYASPGREIKTILLNSPFLRLAGVILIVLALSLPLLPVLALLGICYYAAMLWRYRWSLTYYEGYTLLLVPVVKAIMDIGYDAGLFAAAAFSNKKNFFSGNGRANE